MVRDAAVAAADFDARFSAPARGYRYTVLNRPVPDPFLAAHRVARRPQPLDLRALRLACDPLIGEHDFSSFCRRPKAGRRPSRSLVRRVLDARWDDLGDGVLRFEIEANAFCHQMVRSIVGTLVDVGRGQARAGRDGRRSCGPATASGRPARPAPRPVPVGGRATEPAPHRLRRGGRPPAAG